VESEAVNNVLVRVGVFVKCVVHVDNGVIRVKKEHPIDSSPFPFHEIGNLAVSLEHEFAVFGGTFSAGFNDTKCVLLDARVALNVAQVFVVGFLVRLAQHDEDCKAEHHAYSRRVHGGGGCRLGGVALWQSRGFPLGTGGPARKSAPKFFGASSGKRPQRRRSGVLDCSWCHARSAACCGGEKDEKRGEKLWG